MNHFEIHALERRIAETIKKGFSRPPSPHEKSYDSADFSAAAKDITDMLLGDYFVAPHPTDDEFSKSAKTLSKALDGVSSGMESLISALNGWVYKPSPSYSK